MIAELNFQSWQSIRILGLQIPMHEYTKSLGSNEFWSLPTSTPLGAICANFATSIELSFRKAERTIQWWKNANEKYYQYSSFIQKLRENWSKIILKDRWQLNSTADVSHDPRPGAPGTCRIDGRKSGLSDKPIFPQPPCVSQHQKHSKEPEAHTSGACLLQKWIGYVCSGGTAIWCNLTSSKQVRKKAMISNNGHEQRSTGTKQFASDLTQSDRGCWEHSASVTIFAAASSSKKVDTTSQNVARQLFSTSDKLTIIRTKNTPLSICRATCKSNVTPICQGLQPQCCTVVQTKMWGTNGQPIPI